MTREHLEKRKAELINQRDAFLANIRFADGAIAILDELLNPPVTPPPPAQPPASEALKNRPRATRKRKA